MILQFVYVGSKPSNLKRSKSPKIPNLRCWEKEDQGEHKSEDDGETPLSENQGRGPKPAAKSTAKWAIAKKSAAKPKAVFSEIGMSFVNGHGFWQAMLWRINNAWLPSNGNHISTVSTNISPWTWKNTWATIAVQNIESGDYWLPTASVLMKRSLEFYLVKGSMLRPCQLKADWSWGLGKHISWVPALGHMNWFKCFFGSLCVVDNRFQWLSISYSKFGGLDDMLFINFHIK